MSTIEIHAGDGGDDALVFVDELASALSKGGCTTRTEGRVVVVDGPDCL